MRCGVLRLVSSDRATLLALQAPDGGRGVLVRRTPGEGRGRGRGGRERRQGSPGEKDTRGREGKREGREGEEAGESW